MSSLAVTGSLLLILLPSIISGDTGPPEIPDGFTKGGDGYHYKYYAEKRDWWDAVSICKGEGGNLAVIFNQKTRDVVRGFMSEGWIGITDVWNEGTWQTSTEKNLPYTSWAEGEPNNADNAEDCAVQRSDKTWNDISCRAQKSFICQLIADWSPVSCDSTWTASNHKTSDPKTCQIYADNNYCADGTYGSGWRWGTFGDYADSKGRTALVCPECGCEVSCHSTWTASNHKTSNPKTCQIYADNEYCADGTYGSGWRWGTFEDYADSEGRTALVCPECGCEVSCDSTWTASNHKTSNPKTCQIYADNEYCANGTYGSAWLEGWGTFTDWRDSKGRTALVCPECGCKEI